MGRRSNGNAPWRWSANCCCTSVQVLANSELACKKRGGKLQGVMSPEFGPGDRGGRQTVPPAVSPLPSGTDRKCGVLNAVGMAASCRSRSVSPTNGLAWMVLPDGCEDGPKISFI